MSCFETTYMRRIVLAGGRRCGNQGRSAKEKPTQECAGFTLDRLEAPSGEHVVGECRGVVAPAANATDTAEARGVVRTNGASPVKATRRSSGVVRRRHVLGLVVLILGAIMVEVTVDFSRREQEHLVRRGRGGARLATALVVGHLRDGLHLGLELRRQERPEVISVETTAELRPIPAAGVRVRGIHSLGRQGSVGRLERQTRLAGAVGEVIMIDADDAVLERLAVRQLDGELRPRVHRCLGLGVGGRRLALRRDVLGHGLLLVERPVPRVLGDGRLDGSGIGPSGTAAGYSAALGAADRPIVHRVADQVELVSDGTGHAGPCEHDDQADDCDDQDVLDN